MKAKAIVEFGIPQSALSPDHPCALDSGEGIPFPSAVQAAKAALKIAHVLGQRKGFPNWQFFYVTRSRPRVTWWAADRRAWVTVSLLDGVARGCFAATVKE